MGNPTTNSVATCTRYRARVGDVSLEKLRKDNKCHRTDRQQEACQYGCPFSAVAFDQHRYRSQNDGRDNQYPSKHQGGADDRRGGSRDEIRSAIAMVSLCSKAAVAFVTTISGWRIRQ